MKTDGISGPKFEESELPIESVLAQSTSEISSPIRASSRELLIGAAADLYTKRPYDSVSTREIADVAGVNQALIQYHFGSKAKLFIATVDHLTEGNLDFQKNRRAVPSEGSPLEGFKALSYFIKDFVSYLLRDEPCDSCRLVYREIFSGPGNDPEMFEEVVSFIIERYANPTDLTLAEILKLCRPDLAPEDLKLLGNSILGQCIFYVTHEPILDRLSTIQVRTPESARKVSLNIIEFSLRGLGCEQSDIKLIVDEVFEKAD